MNYVGLSEVQLGAIAGRYEVAGFWRLRGTRNLAVIGVGDSDVLESATVAQRGGGILKAHYCTWTAVGEMQLTATTERHVVVGLRLLQATRGSAAVEVEADDASGSATAEQRVDDVAQWLHAWRSRGSCDLETARIETFVGVVAGALLTSTVGS